MAEVYGVVSPYRYDDETSGLNKAALVLTIPSDEVAQKLSEAHDKNRFGGLSWEEFIRPFQLQFPHDKNQLTIKEFILENDHQPNRSRFQVVETNESSILFMFGDQARIFTYQLRLLQGGFNLVGQDTDWFSRLENFYHRFNGTIIASYGLKLSLQFDREIHDIVWLNFDAQRSADTDTLASVTIQAFVVNKKRPKYTLGRRS